MIAILSWAAVSTAVTVCLTHCRRHPHHGGDPSKMTDPHLIIYNPVLTFEKTTIVTNGDQTNTIYDFMSATIFPVSALKPR